MFSTETYTARRRAIIDADQPEAGLVLLLGNEQSPMNYEANPYPFRQDSTFLYYFGLDLPALDGVIDLDTGTSRLYGDDRTLDDVVWMGDRPSIQDYGERVGVDTVGSASSLQDDITAALDADRSIHVIPPYRPRHYSRLKDLLGVSRDRIDTYVSNPLIRTIVQQRSVKSTAEVAEVENALLVTAEMHEEAMSMATPGRVEREIAGRITGIAEARGTGLSFRQTCSIHGEVLHNHEYDNSLTANDLLLVDAGASSSEYYAGDITRVTPVGGRFTSRQRDIYRAVLDAEESAIDAIRPGISYREVHLHSARVLTEHLVEIGLMNGPVEDAVDAGAHALFFPHGLGHFLGLDAHDMENLGEDVVGYGDDQTRSDQFGLHTLRLARPLQPGFVLTVEPGCYFIPKLIRRWRSNERHSEFINYEKVADFEGFGGIRIEDDVLVTDEGAHVLGPEIPKSIAAVEHHATDGAIN